MSSTGNVNEGDWETLLGPDGDLPLATEDTYLDAYRKKATSGEFLNVLTFDIADERHALALTDVVEIRRYSRPTPIPRTRDFLLGLIALRGTVLPVVDLRLRLGLQATEPTLQSRYLLLAGTEPLGLLVDRVIGVVGLERDKLEPPPATIGPTQAEFIEGIGRHDQQMIVVLRAAALQDFDAVGPH